MDQHASSGERRPKPRPQLYVQFQFGLSWTDQQAPKNHTVTYKSRNLKNSRECGNYPRQLPPPNTNFLAIQDARHPPAAERHHRSKPSRAPPVQQPFYSYYGHPGYTWGQQPPREHQRPRDYQPDLLHPTARPRRESRAANRSGSIERGRSAPPLFLDSPWDVDAAPSSSLFPPPQPKTAKKSKPAPPSQFRLGSDGMPWQALPWDGGAVPADDYEGVDDDDNDDSSNRVPFMNRPTTVPLEGPERCRIEDPSRVQDLETLSTAMMTVDNGFENQWWNQGGRTPTDVVSREYSPDYLSDDCAPVQMRATSMPEPVIVSALEPTYTSRPDWFNSPVEEPEEHPAEALRRGVVSPMSEVSNSPAASFRSLHRPQSTRSDEGTVPVRVSMPRYA